MTMSFLPASALQEHQLSCAFARAEALAQVFHQSKICFLFVLWNEIVILWTPLIFHCKGEVPGLETRGQARAFLMEIYGVVEGLAANLGDQHPALWHPRLLQAGLHLLQGELDLNTGQLASAENELKMASQTLANLESVSQTSPNVVVVAARVKSGLAKLAWERGQWDEAEGLLLWLVKLGEGSRGGEFSLLDLARADVATLQPSGGMQLEEILREAEQLLMARGLNSREEREALRLHKGLATALQGDQAVDTLVSLARYFTARKEFSQARSYLALGDWLLERDSAEGATEMGQARIEYFLALMEASEEKLEERKRVMVVPRKQESLGSRFSLPNHLVAKVEDRKNRYPDTPGKNWEDTAVLLRKGLAEAHNLMNEVSVVMAVVRMWSCLAAFLANKVPSLEVLTRQAKIQRRRIRLLENCLEELQKGVCDKLLLRSILWLLTECYMELLEVKQKKFERTAGS